MNSSNNASWFSTPFPKPEAKARLYIFPYAGAGAAPFISWGKQFPASIELCQVIYPGRETRYGEPLCTKLSALVAAIAESLVPRLDRPFAFFGHSMGAVIAFEISRLLQRRYSLSQIQLFVSGHRAPHLPDREPLNSQLPDDAFLDKLREYDGTPSAFFENRELVEIFLPILRADIKAMETYQYADQPPLDCSISAFGGSDDPRASIVEIEAWSRHTNNSFSAHILPGKHFFIFQNKTYMAQKIIKQVISEFGAPKNARGTDGNS